MYTCVVTSYFEAVMLYALIVSFKFNKNIYNYSI